MKVLLLLNELLKNVPLEWKKVLFGAFSNVVITYSMQQNINQ